MLAQKDRKGREQALRAQVVCTKVRTSGICLTFLCILSACTSVPGFLDEDERAEITVGKALEDIGVGFVNLKNSLQEQGMVLGLYPCRVKIALDIKAGRKRTDGLVVGTGEDFEKVLSLAGEYNHEVVSERGNTVQIELYNAACLPPDTLGFEKPEMIDAAMQGMAVGQTSEKPPIAKSRSLRQKSEETGDGNAGGSRRDQMPANIVDDRGKPVPQTDVVRDHPTHL